MSAERITGFKPGAEVGVLLRAFPVAHEIDARGAPRESVAVMRARFIAETETHYTLDLTGLQPALLHAVIRKDDIVLIGEWSKLA